MEQVIQCLSAFLGCLGFAFVFRVHRHLPYALLASLGGMLGWIVYLLVIPYLSNIMSNLCAMIVVALFSEIMARICKAPATIFIVVGCFCDYGIGNRGDDYGKRFLQTRKDYGYAL